MAFLRFYNITYVCTRQVRHRYLFPKRHQYALYEVCILYKYSIWFVIYAANIDILSLITKRFCKKFQIKCIYGIHLLRAVNSFQPI